eukprot:221561-Hanusia_phi.AAC.3
MASAATLEGIGITVVSALCSTVASSPMDRHWQHFSSSASSLPHLLSLFSFCSSLSLLPPLPHRKHSCSPACCYGSSREDADGEGEGVGEDLLPERRLEERVSRGIHLPQLTVSTRRT